MKTIVALNFKGGVGKTIIAWLLANYLAKERGKNVLVMDLDAQMSLTLSVTLQEETGRLNPKFQSWYDKKHKRKGNTILDGIDTYEHYVKGGGSFNFPVGYDFIFTQLHPNLGFVPSVAELYWLELGVFDPTSLKSFMEILLTKVEGFLKTQYQYSYDYCFMDCPPSFNFLSYSALHYCNLVLVPVNPDVFASRGIEIMLEGLEAKISPKPLPKVMVFMNKAKSRSGELTRETLFFLGEVKKVCTPIAHNLKIETRVSDAWIPERVDIKRAVPRGDIPKKNKAYFEQLWENIEDFIG